MAFPLLAIPAIMSGIGALMKGIGKNKPASTEQIQRFTQPQQQGINQILQQALSGLGQPLGQGFAPIAQQARTQFAQNTIPSIAERFSGMGAGAQGSSAFGQQLGQAGAGLEGQLAGQQSQFGLQEQGLLQQLLGIGLTPQFDSLYKPESPGKISQFGGALMGIGSGLMGPMGQMQGMNQGLGGLQQLGGGY